MLDLLRQTSVPIESIRIDGGTQSRVRIDPETVADYADAMQGGAEFPPVIVYYDGNQYWLADGFHRLQAWVSAWPERTGIPAEVRQGDRREAVLHSVGANDAHGLRRTNEDKRRAVLRLMEDAEWGKWSNREIARRCNVAEGLVRKVKEDAGLDTAHSTQYLHPKTGAVTTMQTGNIGKRAEPEAPGMGGSRWAELAASWLRNRRDAAGRVWSDMTDNQILHANAPWYQDFVREVVRENPEMPDVKTALREGLWVLRAREARATEAVTPPTPTTPPTPAQGRPLMETVRTAEERDVDSRLQAADQAEADHRRQTIQTAVEDCQRILSRPAYLDAIAHASRDTQQEHDLQIAGLRHLLYLSAK